MNNDRIDKVLTAGFPREWADTKQVYEQFGIKRGTLYNLFNDGKIDGRVVAVRGTVKGLRLWKVDSIRRLIESSSPAIEDESTNKTAPIPVTEPRLNGIGALPNVNFSFSA